MNSRLLFVSATAIMVAAIAWAGCSSEEDTTEGTAGAAGAGKGGAAGSVNKGGSAGSVNKGGEAGSAQGGAAGSAEGGAAGQATGGSGGGSTDCTGILNPNDCATCIETNCCPELAACADEACINCAAGSAADCDSTNQTQADALSACLTSKCETDCGGEPPVEVDPACGAPMTSPSAGSCITIDANAGIECNPVTNEPCDTAGGEACDFSSTGFTCYPAPNDAALCGACDQSAGPYCAGGMTCPGDKCAKFCCNDGDCGANGKCDTTLTGMDVGLCVVSDGDAGVPPVEAGPEAATPDAEPPVDAAVDAPAAD